MRIKHYTSNYKLTCVMTLLWTLLLLPFTHVILGEDNTSPSAVLVYACKKASAAIQVDGSISEKEWSTAVQVSGFTFSGTREFAQDQTVMRLLYDDERLYLAVRCLESKIEELRAEIRQYDGNVWYDDSIEWFIDANHDHLTYWQFIVNSLGARYDGLAFDKLWDCKWTAKVSKDGHAWYVEAAIPFASLQLPTPKPGQLWGFNLCRERYAGGGHELINWSNVEGNFHRPALFGHLLFVSKDWSEREIVAKAITSGAGSSIRLFIGDGYYDLRKNAPPKRITYRELLKSRITTLQNMRNELKDIYAQRASMPLYKEFQKLEKEHSRIEGIASSDKVVSAEAWATSVTTLDAMQKQMGDLYWKVKMKLLLRKL